MMRGYCVTAPSDAEDTSLAYLASTPLVYLGFIGLHAALRSVNSSSLI